jgi:hypothetical protein
VRCPSHQSCIAAARGRKHAEAMRGQCVTVQMMSAIEDRMR